MEDIKVYFKSKKELDKYTTHEQLMHQGYVAEIEQLEKLELRDFINKIVNPDKLNVIRFI